MGGLLWALRVQFASRVTTFGSICLAAETNIRLSFSRAWVAHSFLSNRSCWPMRPMFENSIHSGRTQW
jgi:hypothetical protein